MKKASDMRQELDALSWKDYADLADHIEKIVAAATTRSEAMFLLASCALWITGKVADGERARLAAWGAGIEQQARFKEDIRRGEACQYALAHLCGVFSALHERQGAK